MDKKSLDLNEDNQKELIQKQREFEVDQQLLEKSQDYYERKEKVRSKLISWSILILTFLLVLFLIFKLLI